jgi:thiosulfate/3-mercaptopyruvate sulfurtransferase
VRDKILVSAQELRAAQASKSCLVFDCRFVLSDPGSGYRDYLDAHIPGALYAHLDDDLSSPITPSSGRHPLPDAEKFAAFLARSGWQPGTRVVAYDLADGSIAARLWWLMKYFGHDDVALLDGGFRAWQSAGFELESGRVVTAETTPVSVKARADMVVSTKEILDKLGDSGRVLVDVRASERFRGEVEPIDPVAGHIPGSVNFPFQWNLYATGSFKPVAEVHERLTTLAGRHRPGDLVFMCGSGVTACHALFAAELAGLEGSKLYAGSWSEWIRDPSRPVEP